MGCFLTNSSLGKKLVMSITGCFLVLFILFHMSMNIVAIFSPEAYNTVCAFLGANWYALVGTLVLVAGILIHFIYALVLTVNNYKARGSQRYAVTVKEKGVQWASKNMLALGWIILGGLLLHLFNFWSKMQLVEILGADSVHLLAVVLRGDLPGLVLRPLVPPYARRVVDVPVGGLGQRHLVSAPEMYRQHRGDRRVPRFRRGRAGLFLPESLLRLCLLTSYVEL